MKVDMAHACKTLEFGMVSCEHLARFRRLVDGFNNLYGLSLPIPVFEGGDSVSRLSLFKKFCSGLLEHRSHLWDEQLRVGSDVRWSVSLSLFLFRKTLPSNPPDVVDFIKRMSVPQEAPDDGFINYVRREIPRIFRRGWDRSLYSSAAITSVMSTSSCVENGRSGGGVRGLVSMGNSSISGREGFILSTLTKVDPHRLPPSRVVPVQSGGKWRVISVPGADMSYLKPLHTAMYNHLSRFPWLLRGNATPGKFGDFFKKDGEVFVSGDYESATDNLNQHVQSEILDCILRNSEHVPDGVKADAIASLHLTLSEKGGFTAPQARGQMMGNLLSFPLLCLVNYLTFTYILGKDKPVRINGDDIVFRSSEQDAKKWMEGVSCSGLTLSKGKTVVSGRYFTLNSSLFKGGVRGVKALPFIRSKALFSVCKDRDAISSLPGRFRSFCPGFSGSRRKYLRIWWLKENRGLIEASRRSLTRGLGLPVKLDEVMGAGLWFREAWYLSLPVERPLPSSFSEWMRKPKGWQHCRVERVTKEHRAWQKEVSIAFVESSWEPPCAGRALEWEEQLVGGLYDWSHFFYQRRFGSKRRAKLLGLSVQNTRRFLSPDRRLFEQKFSVPKRGVWVPCLSTCEPIQAPLEACRGNVFIPPPSCLTS